MWGWAKSKVFKEFNINTYLLLVKNNVVIIQIHMKEHHYKYVSVHLCMHSIMRNERMLKEIIRPRA